MIKLVSKPSFDSFRIFNKDLVGIHTDTDSLTYEIFTSGLYKDLKEIQQYFDTSNYPSGHFLYSLENKKKVCYFKDETAGRPIKSFVGLRSKMYAYFFTNLSKEITEKKTAKGIPKNTIKNQLTFHNYERMLNFPFQFYVSSFIINSARHNIFTSLQNKLALSPFDDKRCILPNGIDTLAHGHYLIPFLLRILKDIWH